MRSDPAPSVPELSLPRIGLRFLRYGALAWGGPIAQIAMLRRELVDRDGWIASERFNRTLAVYQALPGPEAQELTIFFGMLARGRVGGLVAGLAFVLPGFVLIVTLAWLYVEVGITSPLAMAAFAGCQAAVLALIAHGLWRIGSRAVTDRYLLLAAGIAFVCGLAGVAFLLPLAAAGLGYALIDRRRVWQGIAVLVAVASLAIALALAGDRATQPPSTDAAARSDVAPAELFVSGLRAGALTFGGAYTAIPFVQDDATGPDGWMTTTQFLDGIALSGVIPAPLIIFGTFVGYVGGGLLGAIAITAGIFLPAFVITLVGHEQLEAIIGNRRIHALLDGVTAGVVGLVGATVIHLAPAALGSVAALVIFGGAVVVLQLWRAGVGTAVVIAAAAAAGILLGA